LYNSESNERLQEHWSGGHAKHDADALCRAALAIWCEIVRRLNELEGAWRERRLCLIDLKEGLASKCCFSPLAKQGAMDHRKSMALQSSQNAARGAYEEAGVRGRVFRRPLGQHI